MLQASVRNHDQTGRWELPPRMATRTNCVVMDKVPGIELTRHSTCSPSHGSAGKIRRATNGALVGSHGSAQGKSAVRQDGKYGQRRANLLEWRSLCFANEAGASASVQAMATLKAALQRSFRG